MASRSDEIRVVTSRGEHGRSKVVHAALEGHRFTIGEHDFTDLEPDEVFRYANVRVAPNSFVHVTADEGRHKIRFGIGLTIELDTTTLLQLAHELES